MFKNVHSHVADPLRETSLEENFSHAVQCRNKACSPHSACCVCMSSAAETRTSSRLWSKRFLRQLLCLCWQTRQLCTWHKKYRICMLLSPPPPQHTDTLTDQQAGQSTPLCSCTTHLIHIVIFLQGNSKQTLSRCVQCE